MAPEPKGIEIHRDERLFEIHFTDERSFKLPFEYLRVYSPSAEVRGHHPDQAVLQTGKRNVRITQVEPVGNYAVRLVFDDGHSTGIYTWEWLYMLGDAYEQKWAEYLHNLEEASASRDP